MSELPEMLEIFKRKESPLNGIWLVNRTPVSNYQIKDYISIDSEHRNIYYSPKKPEHYLVPSLSTLGLKAFSIEESTVWEAATTYAYRDIEPIYKLEKFA